MKIILLIALMYPACAYAQLGGTIVGPGNKNIPDAEVFINATTIHTKSDAEGNFELTNVPAGFMELVVFKKGFKLYQSRINIKQGTKYTLNLALEGLKGKKSRLPEPFVVEFPSLGLKRYFLVPGGPSYYEYQFPADDKKNLEMAKANQQHFKGTFRSWLINSVKYPASKIQVTTLLNGYHKLHINDSLQIDYEAEDRTYRSTIISHGTIEFNDQGVLINPAAVEIRGAMADDGPFSPLPLNYVAVEDDIEKLYEESFKRFYEQTYVQTDKPYYYPGEVIWLKAYQKYNYPDWRDSLSRVMYVELIDSDKRVVADHALEIKQGTANSDIGLPDTLRSGTYFIRAYTNVQRNFGDENLHVKPIHILRTTEKPVTNTHGTMSEPSKYVVTITPDKNHTPDAKRSHLK